MDKLNRPREQAGSTVFVEWYGHWYGVPNTLADNMKKAGFAVRTNPPKSAKSFHSPKPKL